MPTEDAPAGAPLHLTSMRRADRSRNLSSTSRLKRPLVGMALLLLVQGAAVAADSAADPATPAPQVPVQGPPSVAVPDQPWARSAVNLESGILWEIGTGTPFPYRLIPTMLSWRSADFTSYTFSDGSTVVLRHRLTLIGTVVQGGPENHYFGFAGSPSLEWWNRSGTWSLYGGAGGGFGLIDAKGIKGGEGQDFTLNWFMRGGIEHIVSGRTHLNAGIMYQHMSNGGMTKPNPGIDALGFTVGYSWKY